MKKITLMLFFLFNYSAHGETYFVDHSVSLLQGYNYEMGDSERNIVTFEHTSGHSWGGLFVFVDRMKEIHDGGAGTYTELSPSFTLASLGDGLVKDINLATTWEMSSLGDNYLVGLGSSLNLPGFKHFSVRVYQRLNDAGDDNQQLTLVWGLPFNMAGYDFMFDGFMDHETDLNDNASTNFTPQLKMDVAKIIGYSKKLYVGIEYVNWTNKFHNDGVNENNVNMLLKAHF